MPKRTHDGLRKRCDCPRRQWAKCAHPWHFSFHHAGVEHRSSLDVVARARGEQPPVGTTEAKAWRDRLRGEIRAGLNPDASALAASASLTVGDVTDRYLSAYVGRIETEPGDIRWSGRHLRPRTAEQAAYHLAVLRRTEIPAAGGRRVRFEQRPIVAVTKADVEAIRDARRPHGVVGTNRLLARLRHVFNWAVGEGYLDVTPFKRGPVTVVRLETGAEAPRTRRLEPGEEDRLLAHATPPLRALIVAALSTGCRVGELLSLQWAQIRRDGQGQARWIVLAAEDTKTNEARSVPIGPRLRAELDMRRHGPDGTDHAPGAFVFGNACGERVVFPQLAWMTTVLKAHGVAPGWDGTRSWLSAESRAAFRRVNLHFHDLRREFACRLRESGASDHDVRDFLGHANITTTSRYLRSTPVRLAQALARMEDAAGFAHDSHTASDPAEAPAAAPHANRLN